MKFLSGWRPYLLAFFAYCFLTLPLLLPSGLKRAAVHSPEAIVVLGGGLTEDCQLTETLKARMNKGIAVWKKDRAKLLLLTGGSQKRCVEAEAMSSYALSRGVPEAAIIKESQALNTYQNAYYSNRILKKKRIKQIKIVTSDFHVRRANLIFSSYQGLNYQMVPAPHTASGAKRTAHLIREQFILCYHALFGLSSDFGLSLSKKNDRTTTFSGSDHSWGYCSAN